MPGFATLRLTLEPYMLSFLRIVVGLLYMKHGLAKGFRRLKQTASSARRAFERNAVREPIRKSVTTFGHYLQRGGSILTMSLGFPLSAVQDEAGIKST